MSAAWGPRTISNSKNALTDPTTLMKPIQPHFSLAQNHLQDLFQYNTSSFNQISIISLVSRPRGSHLCNITTHYDIPASTWSSFQTSKTTYAEFNSALVYMNHSCNPSVEIEVCEPDAEDTKPGVSGQVRVTSDRDLERGGGNYVLLSKHEMGKS